MLLAGPHSSGWELLLGLVRLSAACTAPCCCRRSEPCSASGGAALERSARGEGGGGHGPPHHPVLVGRRVNVEADGNCVARCRVAAIAGCHSVKN